MTKVVSACGSDEAVLDNSLKRDATKQLMGPRRYRDVGVGILNYLNVIGYALNWAAVFSLNFFVKTLPDIGTVSAKYQTIVSPASWAFSVWGPIYLSELVFVVAQLFPKYRSSHSVRDGVSTWFLAACIFQSLWVFLFEADFVFPALVAMVLIEMSLLCLVASQYHIDKKDNNTWVDYLVLRFPFELHFGWITVATILNVNIVLVAKNASPSAQLATAIVSLGVILMIAALVLFVPKAKPSYVVVFDLVWALNGILAELSNPMERILNTFSSEVDDAVFFAVFCINIIVVLSVLTRFGTDVWTWNTERERAKSFKTEKSESSHLLADLEIEDQNVGDASAMLGTF